MNSLRCLYGYNWEKNTESIKNSMQTIYKNDDRMKPQKLFHMHRGDRNSKIHILGDISKCIICCCKSPKICISWILSMNYIVYLR